MDTTYTIYDRITHQMLSRTYASRRAAQNAADRMDRAYGAIRHIVVRHVPETDRD